MPIFGTLSGSHTALSDGSSAFNAGSYTTKNVNVDDSITYDIDTGAVNALIYQQILSNSHYKIPVRVAATGSVNPSGGAPLVVDDVTVVANDRVLLPFQTNATTCGIWKVGEAGTGNDGAWTRADDANEDGELVGGTMVYVQEGTVNSRTRFTLVTTGSIVIGTTEQTWMQEAPIMRTDISGSLVRSSAALTTSYVTGSNVDVRDYKSVDFMVYVTNKGDGPITRIDMQVVASDKPTPAYEDLAVVQSEAITSGVSTLSDYTLQKDISALSPNFVIMVRAPAIGRVMNLQLKAGAGTATNSAVSVNALRRA